MTKFYKANGRYYALANDVVDLRAELPVDTYMVKYNQDAAQFYLEPMKHYELGRIYGDAPKLCQRILDTFEDRDNSTGVLLAGEKGSGKTTQAKLLSMEGHKRGAMTLVVSEAFAGSEFNRFITMINQPAIVFIDEFEKLYESTYDHDGNEQNKQNALLTLLDGSFPSKKLFVLTCNDTWAINKHMKNRPGRLFYNVTYRGIEPSFVDEYCADNLKDMSKIEDIHKVVSLFADFNFDMLKALVEELNRYGESVQDAIKWMNIDIDDASEYYDREIYYKDTRCDGTVHTPRRFNPLNGFTVSVGAPDFDDLMSTSIRPEPAKKKAVKPAIVAMTVHDLVSVSAGTMIFKKGDVEVRLIPERKMSRSAIELAF